MTDRDTVTDDRAKRPWRYYKLDAEVLQKMCEQLADKLDASVEAKSGNNSLQNVTDRDALIARLRAVNGSHWLADLCAEAADALSTPPPASEDEPSDHDWRDVAMLARRALAFGHQATPQTPERMIERKEEALRAIVTVCERHGAGSSVLREAPPTPPPADLGALVRRQTELLGQCEAFIAEQFDTDDGDSVALSNSIHAIRKTLESALLAAPLGAPPAPDYEALLREVLASGKPNPSNHPTMTAAWTKAAHALRDEELMRAYPLPPALDRSEMTDRDALIARLRAIAARFDMTSTERYEQDAEAFYAQTGYMAPGKDVPMAMLGGQNESERRASYEAWVAGRNQYQQQTIREAADALSTPPPADLVALVREWQEADRLRRGGERVARGGLPYTSMIDDGISGNYQRYKDALAGVLAYPLPAPEDAR